MNLINIRLPETLGCVVISTALLQNLRDILNKVKLNVYTEYPDLFKYLNVVDKIYDVNKISRKKYDIDLEKYLIKRKPQQSYPLKHLYIHMLEEVEDQLSDNIEVKFKRRYKPKIILNSQEIDEAKNIIYSNYDKLKPIVWLQTKTRFKEKDLPKMFWQKIIKLGSSKYNFIVLKPDKYSRRISLAITKVCDAGITLDTFLLHGSQAIQAKNVIALMVSSHKEVVAYSNQIVIDGLKDKNNLKPDVVVKRLNSVLK